MAEIKVDLTGDSINKAIADAVINSLLGEQIKKAVKTSMEGLYSWDNPVKHVVSQLVRDEAEKIFNAEYLDIVRIKVREQITDKLLNEVTSSVVSRLLNSDRR